MRKDCENYGSSWCADFECTDCPVLNLKSTKGSTKFIKGEKVDSLYELLDYLYLDNHWFYWNNKPKHPSILWHMQLGTLQDAVTRGILYVAKKRQE